MEARLEAANRPQVQRKEIEEQRAVGLRGQRHHFALLVLPRVIVNPLQVGGFPAETWAVVHQLAINFARRKIDERHFVVDQNAATNLAYAVQAGQRSCRVFSYTHWLLPVSAILPQSPRAIFAYAPVR